MKECGGILATTNSLDLCNSALRGNLADVLTGEDPGQGANEPQDQLAKRYGGFMRRYGGFMKKSAEVGMETADELGNSYGEFTKKVGESLKELLGAEDGEGGDSEPGERYAAVTRIADLGAGVKELQKRYGGFMRRVGSPNWEENKKMFEGFAKRSWGTDGKTGSPQGEKRYGGFMD